MAISTSPLAPSARPHLTTELLVVGGGLAGLTLALACAKAGLDTVLVDLEAPSRTRQVDFDYRTTALAFASQRVLETLGLWDDIAPAAEPIREIRVADSGSPLFVHYDHRDIGDDPLGFIVENRDLRIALLNHVPDLPSLRHLAPERVVGLERSARRVTAHLAGGGQIEAALAVAADGRKSVLRQSAGIRVRSWSYEQTAIICNVHHERPHLGIAVEHFLPAGPFAILPMTGDRSSIVWTERSGLAPHFLALPRLEFEAELFRRFGDFLGRIEVVTPWAGYKLSLMLAERYTAERLALVSEAAHGIHPISGQGLNLGIRDIAALAELVIDQRRLGLDIGAPEVLERYERWRRFDIIALAAITDGLNRLFSNAVPPIRLARDLGLAAVDRLPPLKRFFMQHAMGVVGDLPRLVRGEGL
jgi:2-octaprenyl-6-methoxyphenol hydroxylase